MIRFLMILIATMALALPARAGKLYAVIIGIDEYKIPPGQTKHVPGAVDDALGMSGLLFDRGYRPSEDFALLVKDSARLGDITESIESFTNKMVEGDVLLFFYSGLGSGGENSEEAGFWPADVDLTGPNTFRSTMLSVQFLIFSLQERPEYTTAVVMIDAVHSGALFGEPLIGPHARLFDNTGVLALSATDGPGNSVPSAFSLALVDGLAGLADTNPEDGVVSAHELSVYASVEIAAKTELRLGQSGEWGDQPLIAYNLSQKRTEPTLTWTTKSNPELLRRLQPAPETEQKAAEVADAQTVEGEGVASATADEPALQPVRGRAWKPAVRYASLGAGAACFVGGLAMRASALATFDKLEDPTANFATEADFESGLARYEREQDWTIALYGAGATFAAATGATFVISARF